MLSRLASALLFLVAFSGATLQANASNVDKYIVPYAACCVNGVNTVQFFTYQFKPASPESGVDYYTSIPVTLKDDAELKAAFFQLANDTHRYKGAKNIVRARVKDSKGKKTSEVVFVRVPCECTKDKTGSFFTNLNLFSGLLDFSPGVPNTQMEDDYFTRIEGTWKSCEDVLKGQTDPLLKGWDPKDSKFLVAVGPLLTSILNQDDVKTAIGDICTYFKNGEACCDIDLVCGNKKDRINGLCEILDYLNKCPGGTFDLKGTMETDDEGIVCANYKGDVTLTHELIVCCNKWKLTAWDDAKWFGAMVPAIMNAYSPTYGTKCAVKPRKNLKCFIKNALEDGKLSVSCVKAEDVDAAEIPCGVTGSLVKVEFQAVVGQNAENITLYFQLESLGPIKVDSTGSKGSKN